MTVAGLWLAVADSKLHMLEFVLEQGCCDHLLLSACFVCVHLLPGISPAFYMFRIYEARI